MTDTSKDEDRAFDESVQQAFKNEGLIVTHYVIAVEVLREDGQLGLVHFASENVSVHLATGMLYMAIDYYNSDDEEGDIEDA